MAINPNIALGINPVQFADPIEQFAKIQGVRNMLAQGPMQQAHLERLNLDNEQTRLENQALPAKAEAARALAERQAKDADLKRQADAFELNSKKVGRLGSLAGTITDEASRDYAVGQALREGILDPEGATRMLNRPYDDALKAELKQIAGTALTRQQQLEQQRQAALDEIKKSEEARAAELHPLARHEAELKAVAAGQKVTGTEPIQAVDKARIDQAAAAATEASRHNKKTEQYQSARLGLESKSKGEQAFSRKKLAQVVLDNPSLYDDLTATEKGHVASDLAAAGFSGFGKPLPAAAVKQLAESRSAITSLKDLREVLKANEQYIGPIAGFQGLNPYSDARKAQANIDLVRQRVGKALEGGVLRKEDEEKYKKILATLRDTPETAIYKVDQLVQNISNDIAAFTDEYRRAGRKVTDPTPAKATQALADAPASEQTAINPKTGERIVLRGGKWVPLPK